jgi:hypothetical protein
VKLVAYFHLVRQLRMRGSLPPLPHVSLWHSKIDLQVFSGDLWDISTINLPPEKKMLLLSPFCSLLEDTMRIEDFDIYPQVCLQTEKL